MSQVISISRNSHSSIGFTALYAVLERYQQQIHHLEPGVGGSAITKQEQYLKQSIPFGLRSFLRLHNGATLFYGDLYIRSILELAPASRNQSNIILFAQMEYEVWAYTFDHQGHPIFGLWQDERFIPLYQSFEDWLMSSVTLLDTGPFENYWEKRQELHPENALFQVFEIEMLLVNGAYEEVLPKLGNLVNQHPTPRHLIHLAHCLYELQKSDWEYFYTQAVQNLCFPLPYLSYVPDNMELWRVAHQHMRDLPIWKKALEELWEKQVSKTKNAFNLQLLEQMTLLYWDILRNEQDLTDEPSKYPLKDFYISVRQCFVDWEVSFEPVQLTLAWIDHLIFQAQHNQAEETIFGLQLRHPEISDLCELRLARIVVHREEPWGLHILFDLEESTDDVNIQAECWLLAAQYCLESEALERAVDYLTEATAHIERLENQRLHTQLWLLKARLAHHEQKLGVAIECIENAKMHNADLENFWLSGKILDFEGNLYHTMKQIDTANKRFEAAFKAFQKWQCKLEMAQTLMHWGRSIQDKTYFVEARKLYKSLQVAIGVAVTENTLADHSWKWYLEEATTLFDQRMRAQRAIGMGMRRIADCPERRLYGIQVAVADSPEAILEMLSTELDHVVQLLNGAEVSVSHEAYPRLVACLELIANHPSYRSTELLLDLLTRQTVSGLVRDALCQILSRVRNISIITEMMQIMPKEGTANIGLMVEILGLRREVSALKIIASILSKSTDVSVQKDCILALGRLGDASAIPLVEQWDEVEGLEEVTSLALLLLGEHDALAKQAQALAGGELGGCVHLGHIIGRYGGPRYLLLLFSLAKSDLPIRISAIHGIGYLGDPRAIPLLIELTGFRDREIAEAASASLELLTGHFEDTEEYLLRARWQSWYEENQGAFEVGSRYRQGMMMTPMVLIDQLADDDRLVRMTAYDELVISTGVNLPFDVDGTWRLQKAHIQAWKSWWSINQFRYNPGEWLYQGQVC